MTGGDPLLDLDAVHTYYGDHHVLQGISFTVGRDEVVAYLGRNGTGKTTTYKAITGVVEPERGTVEFGGDVLNGLQPHVIGRKGVSFVSAENKVFPHLTVRENIKLPTLERGTEPDFESLYELFPDLTEYEDKKAGALSGGQQQMVAIAQGLAPDPDLLLLDEPVQGLAVQYVDRIADLLEELKDANLAIMVIEHDIELALDLADRVLVLDEGQIRFAGTPTELREDRSIIDRYIGVSGFAETD